jgi:hypothetical protein
VTASVGLYIFGLFVAFLARPPVTITNEMQTTYFAKMEAAAGAYPRPHLS